MNTVRVLLVEDSASDAELMLRALRGAGLEPVHERVDNPEAMRQALKRQSWDVVLSDYSMPAFDAPAALVLLQQHSEDIPFIVVSGSVGEDTAVAVMKAGAADYVMKDRLTRLAPAVTRAIDGARLRRDRRRLEQQLQEAKSSRRSASSPAVWRTTSTTCSRRSSARPSCCCSIRRPARPRARSSTSSAARPRGRWISSASCSRSARARCCSRSCST